MWWKALYHGGCGLGCLFALAGILIIFVDGPDRWPFNTTTTWRHAKISYVIDGDTVILQNRERVRVKNCAVPERETDMGDAAYNHVKGTYLGKLVELVDEEWEKDRHGRTLARIVLGEKDLCEELIRMDLAKPWNKK